MTHENKIAEPGTPMSGLIPVAQNVTRGVTYVSLDPDFRGEVTVNSVSGNRVHYSGDADGDATTEEFLKAYAPLSVDNMTIEQLNARANMLSSEMDANEEENSAYQSEIDKIYSRIDSMKF
ncbi:hypothetical protein [Paraburkholderia sediminicola]